MKIMIRFLLLVVLFLPQTLSAALTCSESDEVAEHSLFFNDHIPKITFEFVQSLTTETVNNPITGDEAERTVLHFVCFYGDKEVIRYLFETFATKLDTEILDKDGLFPRDYVRTKEIKELLVSLIEEYRNIDG